MPEQSEFDLRALATYQRRLVSTAMEAVGRVVVVVSGVTLLLGVFGVWADWPTRALLIVLSLGALVVGIGLALAGDYLPDVPGSPESAASDRVVPTAGDLGDLGDPAGA